MALTCPAVKTLPCIALPVLLIIPTVRILPPDKFPVAVIPRPAVTLPTELIPKLDTQTFDAVLYNHVAYSAPSGPTPIPPLFAAVALAALLAILICKSFVVIVFELIVVVVPLTVKLPVITTLPSVPPDPFGSIVNVLPELKIVLPLITIPPTDKVPPVVKFPPVVFPVMLKLVKVPKLVTFGCAAVVNVPVTNVPDKFPPVTLPVTLKLATILTLPIPFGVNTILELAALV